MSVVLLLGATLPSFAQQAPEGDLQARMREVITRADALTKDATSLLGEVRSPQMAGIQSVSLMDYATKLATTIDSLNAVLASLRVFLDKGTATMADSVPKILATLDETKNLLVELRQQSIQISQTLQQQMAQTGTSVRADVTAMREQISTDLTKLFDAGVTQITRVGDDSHQVLVRIDTSVGDISRSVTVGVDQIAKMIDAQGTQIGQSVQRTMDAGVDTIRTINDGTGRVLVTLNDQVVQIGGEVREGNKQIVTSIDGLSQYVANFIQSITAFMNESTATLRDIRIATERTVGFISRLDGGLTLSYYNRNGRTDSAAAVDVWLRPEEGRERRAVSYFHAGGVDLDTDPRLDLRFGVKKGLFSSSFGYIEEGLGVGLGYNRFGGSGVDVELRGMRLSDPRIDLEIGLKHKIGTRIFGFFDDALTSRRSFGGGISYYRSF